MNFDTYIGHQLGQDPGAAYTSVVFSNQLQKINTELNAMQNKNSQDFTDLQTFLNKILFPKENKSKDQLMTLKFYEVLIKTYNQVYKETISKGIKLENEKTYIEYNLEQALAKAQANTQACNRALSTMQKHKDYIKKLIQELGTDSNAEVLKQKVTEINTQIPLLNKAFEDYINAFKGDKNEGNQEWTNYLRQMIVKGENREELLNQLRQYEVFIETVQKTYCTPSSVLGKVFEYALALIGSDFQKAAGSVKNEVVKQVGQIAKSKKIGQDNVIRGENLKVSIDSSVIELLGGDITSESKDKGNGEVKTTKKIKIGNLEFKYNNEFNPSAPRQGKVDVSTSFPGIAGGKTFNISAKNWANASSEKFNLGETSLFSALSRSLGANVTEDYIFTMQHPTDPRRKIGENAVLNAHRLAKAAVLLDIATGYSQKTSADTIVILDRAHKKVLVFDPISIISQIIVNNQFNDIQDMIVKEYDEEEIEAAARELRRVVFTVKRNKNTNNGQRSKNYVSSMQMFLHSKVLSVALNQNLINQQLGIKGE